jgi:hypothetical protein
MTCGEPSDPAALPVIVSSQALSDLFVEQIMACSDCARSRLGAYLDEGVFNGGGVSLAPVENTSYRTEPADDSNTGRFPPRSLST